MRLHHRAVLVGTRVLVSCLVVVLFVLTADYNGKQRIEPVIYTTVLLPQPGDLQLLHNMRHPLSHPHDFYRRLSAPSGRCEKLASLGGYGCTRRLEGNKYICLDPAVAPHFGRCLMYSFGIAYDTTFEQDHWNLYRCDMFLFDPSVESEEVQATPPMTWQFEQIGLSNENRTRPMERLPGAVDSLQPLGAIRRRLGHQHTRLDYLKLDIEGEEWRVLVSLARSGGLANVRQLAMEIHTYDIQDLPQEQWLGALQERYDILLLLEDVGFRRVHSENNTHLVSYIQLPGEDVRIPSCMELLYVKI